MSDPISDSEAAACPPAARPVLARYVAGEVSAEIALMHLLLAAGGTAPLQQCLAVLAAGGREPFVHLADLAARHRDALARAAAVAALAWAAPEAGEAALAGWRQCFDRAVAAAPEAAVALYSLGDPAILARATAELAALLDRCGLLGRERAALDIGCGIGRIEQALAPRLGHIVGIDLSPAMIAEAERRCAALGNVRFAVCEGTGLSQFAPASFDLVLAIDSFPYIVAAGGDLAARHVHDAARLLRPGGALAIFNYSYRGDLAADLAELAALADTAGFRVERDGTRDLGLWDGRFFLLAGPERQRPKRRLRC